jgi:predicted O-linked N-acetylglucosamine transferase (SPINDLY family)
MDAASPTVTLSDAYQLAGQKFAAGQLDEAEALTHRLLVVAPGHPDLFNLLGLIAHRRGDPDGAVGHFERAIAKRPDFPPYHSNLSVLLNALGRSELAAEAAAKAIALDPQYVEAHLNLSLALAEAERLDEALAAYRKVIGLQSDHYVAWVQMGNVLKRQGRLDAALAAWRQAIALQPRDADAHGVLVQSLRYHPGCDAGAIAREEALWNARHAEALRPRTPVRRAETAPRRRLRIGYVSPDFRDHVVGLNVLPLFEAHDRERFEIFCYSGATRPDAVTARFRALADGWRDTAGVPDDALAGTIRQDRVDILVDLALHTAGNRLLVFARQPAPVQVSCAGYPGGTGLAAIGHRISDRHLEGSERAEGVSLIPSFWCYAALATPLEISPLPALAQGRITFGCLNQCWKVNESVLRLWARLLRTVGDGRLVLNSPVGSHRQESLAILAREGIAEERIEFLPRLPRPQYLESYRRLDLVLDTFPYNGHTTSLDAFWMGVPVVTLPGATIVSRAGLSQAMNLGLPGLVAHSEEEYVRIAAELARDLPQLKEMRATLRERMQRSALMDAHGFARGIEDAFRAMWMQAPTRD